MDSSCRFKLINKLVCLVLIFVWTTLLVDLKCVAWRSKIRGKKIWLLTNSMKCLKRNLFWAYFTLPEAELSQHSLSLNFWRVKDVDRKEHEKRSEKWKTYGTIVITLRIYCWRKWWKIRGESWRTRGETWLRSVIKLLFYLKYHHSAVDANISRIF